MFLLRRGNTVGMRRTGVPSPLPRSLKPRFFFLVLLLENEKEKGISFKKLCVPVPNMVGPSFPQNYVEMYSTKIDDYWIISVSFPCIFRYTLSFNIYMTNIWYGTRCMNAATKIIGCLSKLFSHDATYHYCPLINLYRY